MDIIVAVRFAFWILTITLLIAAIGLWLYTLRSRNPTRHAARHRALASVGVGFVAFGLTAPPELPQPIFISLSVLGLLAILVLAAVFIRLQVKSMAPNRHNR